MPEFMRPESIQRRRVRSRGSAIVEVAFIFTVFFCLVLGAFDFGQFLFIHQALVERARYALRWGAVNDASTDQISNMMLYYQTTNPGGGATGYFNLTSNMVTVTKTSDAFCFQSGAQNDWYKRVSIQIHDYPYIMLSPYSAGTYTGPNITIDAPIFQDFAATTTACP